ncbi:hypothetical protein GCM10009551_093150 [Nocardiopsis tropica]|uniref:alcohol dehydrogenase catalytic domain-containing protein n=1 Tax=Tsukamurella TaxID=2060 RepID=UPI001C7DCC07|nr:hypothetical protein [Tsukamurella sp. TY48]GIZ97014.1 hypothetical protein TTY48_16260 [Tsukamurella sp. TY48]
MTFAGPCIGFRGYGGPEVLTEFDDEKSASGPGRAVLRSAFSGVNPVDVSFRTGRMDAFVGDTASGFVPGMECVGEVVSSTAPGLPVGAVVNALTLPGVTAHAGSYAAYVEVDAERAAVVPAGLPAEAAASIPLNGVTASSILQALGPGSRTVVVTGAAGALGRFLVVASAAAGHRTVALAREGDDALLRGLGAHQLLTDGTAGGVDEPDVIIDAANLGAALSERFRSAETVVRVRADTEYPLPHRRLVTANVREAAGAAAHIAWWNARIIDQPEVIGPIECFGPGEAGRAQERLSASRRRGRIVLRW